MEVCDYFHYWIFKSSIFHRVKELLKSNQTWYGVTDVHVECKKRIFGIACLEKKVSISYGNIANMRQFVNNEF